MRRWLGVVSAFILSIFVSGCALPVSVTVASWALDGFSYVATQKSITDHGISLLAGQDCALHRIVTEMDLYALCTDYKEIKDKTAATAIADASEIIETGINKNKVDDIFEGFSLKAPTPITILEQHEAQFKDHAKVQIKEPSIEEIANFETASGGKDLSDFEKIEDPDEQSSFGIKGIWSFIKKLPDFIT
ncbi:MAG: hypothetical protein VB913_12770 [Rhodospirillales bacterium]|jgi:hypothetical protein